MGLHAAAADAVFVSPDYRNFPQGGISDMVDDVSLMLEWVVTHIDKYGGDANNVTVVGQSAGAHLLSLALLRQAVTVAQGGRDLSWRPSDFRRFVGLGGVYDLTGLEGHLHARGLYRWLLRAMLPPCATLADYCPLCPSWGHSTPPATSCRCASACRGRCCSSTATAT